MKRAAKWGISIIGILTLPIFFAIGFWFYVASTLPALETIAVTNAPSCSENSQISRVSIHDLPDYVTTVFIAAEAPGFFRNSGIPSIRLAKDLVRGLFDSSQLSPNTPSFSYWISSVNLRNSDGGSRTLYSQFQRLVQSDRIEMNLGEFDILGIYLNQIYFAKGTIGIACAAQHFFRKKPEALSLAETALLSALTRSPTNFDPYKHPAEAETRRNKIIDQTRAAGFISDLEASSAKAAPLLPQ